MCIRDSLYPVQEHNYRQSESESGLQRNEALQQYIEAVSYTHLDVYKRQVPGPACPAG